MTHAGASGICPTLLVCTVLLTLLTYPSLSLTLPHLAAEVDQLWQRVQHQVGSLLVVEPPDEAQQGAVGLQGQAQLMLQLQLALLLALQEGM